MCASAQTLPQLGSLVFHLSSAALPGSPTGTPLATWTDSVYGLVGRSGGTKPTVISNGRYCSSLVRFNGASVNFLFSPNVLVNGGSFTVVALTKVNLLTNMNLINLADGSIYGQDYQLYMNGAGWYTRAYGYNSSVQPQVQYQTYAGQTYTSTSNFMVRFSLLSCAVADLHVVAPLVCACVCVSCACRRGAAS